MVGFCIARFRWLTRPPVERRVLRPARWFGRPSFRFVVVAASAIPLLALAAATAMSHAYERGLAALAAGDLVGADRALKRAAVLSPNERIELARAEVHLAAFDGARAPAARRTQLALARDQVTRAARLNPYAPEVPYLRMLIAARDPALERAARAAATRAEFDETLRRDRRFFPARLERARALIESGEHRAAHALLEAGLAEVFPPHPLVLDYLALVAELRARHGDAAGAARAWRERQRVAERLGPAT
jgi:hypothetical protein